MRGSPHVHMVLWIDAGNLLGHDGEPNDAKVKELLDKYVRTSIPTEQNDPAGVSHLVRQYQQHHHTNYCGGIADFRKCRFKFPRPLCFETRRRTGAEARLLPKSALYVTPRFTETDRFVNAYNVACLLAWRGNMDIQPITGAKGCAKYVGSFIC